MKIKKLISKHKTLVCVLLLAAFLRLYQLGSVPGHLTPDEAALGYNAFSILQTGKDEHGQLLPVIFKSFGDYKPGLYVYLTVPFVGIMGLNEFAVRLPSALFGIMSVYLVYLLASEIKKFLGSEYRAFSIVVSLLLAINPWHIHFSRGAWEANVALTLTIAGIYFFIKGLNIQKYLYLSLASFVLTVYTYQGAKLASVVVIIVLAASFWKRVIKIKRLILVRLVLIGLLASAPIILSLFSESAGRLKVFSLFSYPRGEEVVKAFINQSEVSVGSAEYYMFYSEAQHYAKGLVSRWLNHYSPKFLFIEGDWNNPRHGAPYHGMLLLSDLALLSAGFVAFSRNKWTEGKKLIFLWLLLASLPSALSRDSVNAVRALNMVVPLVLLSSLGMSWSLTKLRRPAIFLSFMVYLLNFAYFANLYFVHLNPRLAPYWEFGQRETAQAVWAIQDRYDEVIVEKSYGQPYIYYLFYEEYDPAIYQREKIFKAGDSHDVGMVEKFGKFYFSDYIWAEEKSRDRALIVGSPEKIPLGDVEADNCCRVVAEIYYPDGQVAQRIVETLHNDN